MTASTFLLLLVSLLPILSGKIPLLNFINNSMYNLSTAYITTFFIHFLYIAIACMILTIIVSYLYIRLKRSITISKNFEDGEKVFLIPELSDGGVTKMK